MQPFTGNPFIDYWLTVTNERILLTAFGIITFVCVFILVWIWRFGAIGTGVAYLEKGGTLRIWKAKENERSVWVKGYTWSKLRVVQRIYEHGKDKGKPIPYDLDEGKYKDGKEVEYEAAAKPVVYWKGLRPRRIYFCQEGHPTVLHWDRTLTIAAMTADELHILGEGSLAKALVDALIRKLRRDWVLILVVLLCGFLLGLVLYPYIIV